MLKFYKERSIDFYCSLPEVKQTYPIIESKTSEFKWIKDSAICYKNQSKETGIFQHVSGTAKCNGIMSLVNQGYLLRSWFDLTIKTFEDPYRFEFFVPESIFSFLQEKNYNKSLVSWFSGDDPVIKIPLNEGSFQTVLKIVTPWAVTIPKGYKLLIMPVPYADETNFESMPGILTSGNFYEINPIIKINKKPGELFIPAGTPLCYFIPMKEENVKVKFKDYNEKIKKEELKTMYNLKHRFLKKFS